MPSFPETPASWTSLLRPEKRSKSGTGGIFKMFKLLPMLTTGCKVVGLLGHHRKGMLGDKATTVTLFGHRRGKIIFTIQEDTRSPPVFLIELPMLTATLHKEMNIGPVKIALESDTRTGKKKLLEEYVWAVYVNGRKAGYSIRRKDPSDDERFVMRLLRGVSVGVGVVPEKEMVEGGEMSYMRARCERVVGSKDSEAYYMISPDGSNADELSIFLMRRAK